MREWIPCAYFILDFKFSRSSRDRKRKPTKFHPTYKIGSNTQCANELLIEIFLKERSNPRFRPYSKDFMDNSNVKQTFMSQKNLMFANFFARVVFANINPLHLYKWWYFLPMAAIQPIWRKKIAHNMHNKYLLFNQFERTSHNDQDTIDDIQNDPNKYWKCQFFFKDMNY